MLDGFKAYGIKLMLINVQYAKIAFDGKGKILGLTTGDGKNVYIQRGLGKKRTFEVMVHELTHASLIHCKIKRSNYNHERIAKQVGRYARAMTWKRRTKNG